MAEEEKVRFHALSQRAGYQSQEARARAFFRAVFADEREAEQQAREFLKLTRALAVAQPEGPAARQLAEQFYRQLAGPEAAGSGPEREVPAETVRAALTEMSEANRAARSSPQARRAHLEIDSYSRSDDLHLLLETPEGRTRAAHAGYLNQVDPAARDLYERGAVVAGDAIIIPREADSAPDRAEQIRMGSLTHAVQTFAPLVGAAEARRKAAEFVTLGREIAGRAAEGDSRLVVFREYYGQVQRDEKGRLLTQAEQAAQLDTVLAEMRPLAAAMREQEWTREAGPTVSLDDWERGLETRSGDPEHEYQGRLTATIGEMVEQGSFLERGAGERTSGVTYATPEPDEFLLSRGVGPGSYERLSFAAQPPRMPGNLSEAATTRLRYEVVPYLDRQLENGVQPAVLLNQLARQYANEERNERSAVIGNLLRERAPTVNQELAVTRAEEARALYTLRTLGVPGADDILRQRGFTGAERAGALDTVGARLAQDYRGQLAHLQAFAALDVKRAELTRAAEEYAQQQRSTPEWQTELATLKEREISGPQPALRRELAALLVNPEVNRLQQENDEQFRHSARALSQIAGQEITTVTTARAALAPGLRMQRSTLDRFAGERATLDIPRTTRADERQPNPLYVAQSAQPQLRLAVANLNEYRVLTNSAEKAGVKLHTYAGLPNAPLDSVAPTRAAELTFAREYLQYRLTDETTRLRHTNRLFREFDSRLTQARTADELRQTVKEIRQENYARWREPQRFAGEEVEARAYGLQPRTPLNGRAMKQLFLAEAPVQYSDEMRNLRRAASLTGRERQAQVLDLAQGPRQPSPALQTLFLELERVPANSVTQTSRNLKAFLGDYLNPPHGERPRFSRHNLYELHQQLSGVERDYFYKVLETARQSTLPALTRHPEARAVREQNQDGRIAPPHLDGAREERPTLGVWQPVPAQLHEQIQITLEKRVAAYLGEVVNTRGSQALATQREGLEHAAEVSRIVKDTFREKGVSLADYRLNDESIAALAGQLVGSLPQSLEQEYRKQGGIRRLEQQSLERNNILLATPPDHNHITDREVPRGVSPTALEPWQDEKQRAKQEVGKERDIAAPTPSWPPPIAPAQPVRAQEIAPHTRAQPNDRYFFRR